MFEVEMPVIKERPNKSAQKRIAKAASKLAEHLLRLSEKQILKTMEIQCSKIVPLEPF